MASDMGQEVAQLKSRVMALEADPHVIAAQGEAKQVFADALAKVADQVKEHEAAIKEFVRQAHLSELGKTLLGKFDDMLTAHKAEVGKALEAFTGHFAEALKVHGAAVDAKLAAHLESVAQAATAPAQPGASSSDASPIEPKG